MLAVHEGAPLVLRDSAPGLSKHGPPWGIEGEPGGTNSFESKRPFEADIEGDAMGHFGHHQKKPGCIKVPSAPQVSNYYSPRVHTCHRDVALKPPDTIILRPIERACGWRRRRQRAVTNFNMSCPRHMRHMQLHASHASHIPSHAHRIKPSFPLLHERYISPQCPNCV
jgi:hypothetical protein